MAIRPIVYYPDERLRKPSEKVGDNLDGIAELIRDMTDTMYGSRGAGFAAIQIGVPKCVFIIEAEIAGLTKGDPPMVFIDPEIVWFSEETELAEEGCLSFPEVYVPVERAFRVRTRARDITGQPFEIEGEGLFARAMQHEMDHLDTRILVDFVGRIKRKMIKRRMERYLLDEEEAV
jgi:peptide deformylase